MMINSNDEIMQVHQVMQPPIIQNPLLQKPCASNSQYQTPESMDNQDALISKKNIQSPLSKREEYLLRQFQDYKIKTENWFNEIEAKLESEIEKRRKAELELKNSKDHLERIETENENLKKSLLKIVKTGDLCHSANSAFQSVNERF